MDDLAGTDSSPSSPSPSSSSLSASASVICRFSFRCQQVMRLCDHERLEQRCSTHRVRKKRVRPCRCFDRAEHRTRRETGCRRHHHHHPSSIIIIIIIIIIMYDWNQGSPSNRQPPGILSNKIEKLEPTISLEYPLTTALPHCHNICLNFLYFSTSTPPLPSPSIRRCAPTGGWKWMSCPAGIWRWFQPDFLLICSVVNRSLLACSTPQTVLFR